MFVRVSSSAVVAAMASVHGWRFIAYPLECHVIIILCDVGERLH